MSYMYIIQVNSYETCCCTVGATLHVGRNCHRQCVYHYTGLIDVHPSSLCFIFASMHSHLMDREAGEGRGQRDRQYNGIMDWPAANKTLHQLASHLQVRAASLLGNVSRLLGNNMSLLGNRRRRGQSDRACSGWRRCLEPASTTRCPTARWLGRRQVPSSGTPVTSSAASAGDDAGGGWRRQTDQPRRRSRVRWPRPPPANRPMASLQIYHKTTAFYFNLHSILDKNTRQTDGRKPGILTVFSKRHNLLPVRRTFSAAFEDKSKRFFLNFTP